MNREMTDGEKEIASDLDDFFDEKFKKEVAEFIPSKFLPPKNAQ